MGIRKRWINALHKVATGTKRTRTLLTPVGLTIFGTVTVLFVLAALLLDRLLGLSGLLPRGVRLLLSIPLMALGAAFIGWSAFHFLKEKGTPVPFNPPPRLVRSGPYRHVRNPMLTGVFFVLFGIGICIDSVSLVFFFTPLFVLVNVWELKRIEEPELIKRFGIAYIVYRSRTPMFIPSLAAMLRDCRRVERG